jgi:hypothetical protein
MFPEEKQKENKEKDLKEDSEEFRKMLESYKLKHK